MGCCGQNPVGSGTVSVDTCKRVNYTLGMLLGVDDFVQETAYHSARRRQLAREVLGYGTVRGLQVVVEADGDAGPRLRVTPGVALLPSGTLVCVDADQCCSLNDWLAAHPGDVATALADDSPPADLRLFVVLVPSECLTDNVPIPGEPCRSEDELMKPSRIADGFRLELRLQAPLQREEDAVRDFVDWLTSVPVGADSPPLSEADFVEQVRAAARAWLEPTSPPADPGDFMTGLPPSGFDADEGLLRLAIRLWTTELRPLWIARADCGCGSATAPAADDALLLAALDVPLAATGGSGGWQVASSGGAEVEVDESRRPVLLSLRMVQELIAQVESAKPGDSVVAATTFGMAADAGVDTAYSRADHSHGTPALPPLPDLAGDVGGGLGANHVDTLQSVPLTATGASTGQALLFDGSGWSPGDVLSTLPALGGDVTGPIGNATVARLQGRPMSATAPASGEALVFDGTDWAPAVVTPTLPPFGGDLTGTIGSERIAELQGNTVDAATPAEGDVLQFVGGRWVPAAAPGGTPAGDFVGRNKMPFEIVAGGQALLNMQAVGPSMRSSYGGLKAVSRGPGALPNQAVLFFSAVVARSELDQYIIKATPVWPTVPPNVEFRLYADPKVRIKANSIEFSVTVSIDRKIDDGDSIFPFYVEVSRFRNT